MVGMSELFIKKYTRQTQSSQGRMVVKRFLLDLDLSKPKRDVIRRVYKDAEIYRWDVPIVKLLIAAVTEAYAEAELDNN